MKTKIYIKQWLQLKPENYSSKTDLHYLKIANTIYTSLDYRQKLVLQEFMDQEDIANLCCFLTCYYEDVISQTNIWQAFKKLYAKSYQKTLPFYNLSEGYLDDEINAEDVAFLIWYFINSIQGEKFANPHNDFIRNIAEHVMAILDEDYEFAPENTVLQSKYRFSLKAVNEADEFYIVREFLQTVFFDSYLFQPDIKRQMDQEVFEILEEHQEEETHVLMSYMREITEGFTFNKTSALLALNAKDFAMAVVGEATAEYNAISTISLKMQGLFLYKSQTETDVTLEHIASGMLFEMTKKSFDNLEDLKLDYITYIGLVNYKDEWWFSGNFFANPFDADLILDQKNSAEARAQVSFLEDQEQINSIMEQQKQAFLDFNQGSLVAFLKSDELNRFLQAYYEFYNNSLKISDEEKQNAHNRAKSEGYFGDVEGLDDYKDAEDLFVVFFNPKSGIEFYDDIVNAFPDERNPFFTKEDPDDVVHVLMSDVCSTEFTNYFIENYKDKLNYFKIEPYKSYLNDLDFLLKFWKKDNYKTKSNMVLTGKN